MVKIQEIRNFGPIAVFVAVFLKMPLASVYCFAQVPHHSTLEIFSDGAIAALALFLIFLKTEINYRKMLPLLTAAAVMTAAVILQTFKLSFFRIDYVLGALLPPVLIVFAWLYGAECRKYIFPALAVCWFLNLVLILRIATHPMIVNGRSRVVHGLAGNWNWSYILLLASTAAALYLIYHHIRKPALKIAAGLLLLLGTVCQFHMLFSFSRGSILALTVAAGVFLLIWLYRFQPKAIKILLCLIPLAAIAGGVFVYLNFNSPLFDFVRNDARYHLIPGGLRIAAQNSLVGISPELYESYALKAFDPAYFLSRFVSERSPHPHNELLFIAVAYGLPAFLAWLYLIFWPVPAFVARLTAPGLWREKILFFCFLIMLVSGMVDVTLANWPCKYFFLLIAGIFWYETEPPEPTETAPFRNGFQIMAALSFCAMVYLAVLAGYSSWLYRQAEIHYDRGDGPGALRLLSKSVDIKPEPLPLYRAGLISLFDARNPDQALQYFQRIPGQTGRKNYMGMYGMLARIYSVKGQTDKALEYFQKELEIYPYSILNWDFYSQVLDATGQTAKAEEARKERDKSMELKNLKPQHMRFLRQNQLYDLKAQLLLSDIKDGIIHE